MNQKTWVEINGNNLRSNIESLGSLLSSGVLFCAVVKANAYGHDLETIVRLTSLQGIDTFAVDSIDEAIKVKATNATATIYILGYTVPGRLFDVVRNGFIQTVYDEETIKLLGQLALKDRVVAKVNLKIETGTIRQGVAPNKVRDYAFLIEKERGSVELESISSHFADSENTSSSDFCLAQNEIFRSTAENLARLSAPQPKHYHIGCSASAINYPETHYNMVRIGIAMYGLWSTEKLMRKNQTSGRHVDLKPVLSWKTRIAQIKDVKPGTSVGYGRSFVTDRPMRIAVLPVGYYDGYRRSAAGKGYVLIHGQKCKVLGAICMNMMMVDVSQVQQSKVGDTATILGRDGMNEIKVDNLSEWFDTINHEAVTGIGSHLPRIVI